MDTQPVMYDAPTSEKVVECVAVGFAVFSVWNLALLLRRAEAPFGPAKALSWLAQTIALVYHLASIPRLIELFTGTSRIVSGTAIFGLLWRKSAKFRTTYLFLPVAFMIPPTCLERVSERIGIELRSWQRTALVVVAVVIPVSIPFSAGNSLFPARRCRRSDVPAHQWLVVRGIVHSAWH